MGTKSIKFNYFEGLKNLDFSVSENHWNHVYIIDNSNEVKSKGDVLSLLLEIDNGKIINISDNFFSLERKLLLPCICKMLNNSI